MVAALKPKDLDLKIKFGGGLHTRASADEIDAREASAGQNFLLDLENRELRNRPPFDLIGTVPNAAEIRGGATLLKSDGTVSTIFQAAGNVYSWDGGTTFTLIGTCNSSSKLRGHWRSHNWNLADKVLITDLSLVDVVKEWNGTTFQSCVFTKETGAAFGTFYAKYLFVTNERAVFGHVRDPGATSPHMMVGSQISNYNEISIANAPSSSLSTADPFYILSPDLKPINGMENAFGATIVSTEKGQLFNLTGTSAKDFAFETFFPGSYASGAESLAYIGTDIVYGRQGRIESVRDTNTFGNSEADDLTRGVADIVAGYSGWTLIYNGRVNKLYLFPTGQSEVWVFNPAMRATRTLGAGATDQYIQNRDNQLPKLSPWMRWNTTHALAFQPTFAMSMLDPLDGLEYMLMGDASGNVYRMEGSGASGDGGTQSVDVTWTSKVFSAPLDAKLYDLVGYIKYKKSVAMTITLTFLYAGVAAFDQSIVIDIPALTGAIYYGGLNYYGGSFYYGSPFSGRLIRQNFPVAGGGEDFQVKIEVNSTSDFNINEIGLRFTAAS